MCRSVVLSISHCCAMYLQNFSSCKTETIYIQQLSIFPFLNSLTTTILFSVSRNLHVVDIKVELYDLSSHDWLISLGIMSSKVNNVEIYDSIFFPFKGWITFHCNHNSSSIHVSSLSLLPRSIFIFSNVIEIYSTLRN